MTNPEGFWTFQNGLVFESQHLSRGVFLLAVRDLIIGFAIFLVVKQMKGLKTPEIAGAETTRACPYYVSTIPDHTTKCTHRTSNI